MTIHYHGTPVTPREVMLTLAGRCFCVSAADPRDVALAHRIGQSVMLDNGAFSEWMSGKPTNWPAFYGWVGPWLDYPTTWAVIPDVIDGTEEEQDRLLREWPAEFRDRGAPVWHMNESIDRLLRLLKTYPRVCIGSTGAYAVVGDERWHRRMVEAWNAIERALMRTPWVHMLRGMQVAGGIYPFASVDSTDIARHHERQQNVAAKMADRWDGMQCPGRWSLRPEQVGDLLGVG